MTGTVAILYGSGETPVDDAFIDGSDLWLRLNDLSRATGWIIKPEGACLDDVCVPLSDRERYLRGEGQDVRFSLTALAERLEQPVAVDVPTRTWCFGTSASTRVAAFETGEAPDFSLPDLSGRMHKLSDYRGKRVFLVAWASW